MIKNNIYKILLKIKKNDYKKEYNTITKIDSKDSLLHFHEAYLEKLLIHSFQNVSYYKNMLKKIGIIKNNTIDLTK